jgi:3-mercaptopyruvate sulfurtransferase SseA
MKNLYGVCTGLLFILFIQSGTLLANPDLYPQFAQQEEALRIQPQFVKVEQLVDDIIHKKRPLIVDVRNQEEFEQAHIKGSVSIPLGEIPRRLTEIPKDKPVVLY